MRALLLRPRKKGTAKAAEEGVKLHEQTTPVVSPGGMRVLEYMGEQEKPKRVMSRLDDLLPDQRAVLSLLLRQRKTYPEVAALLSIAERSVRDRAHAALAVLAPRQASELTAERREGIGDYLLGQQAVSERLQTQTYLMRSAPGLAWASAISAELAALTATALREIPAPSGAPAVDAHDAVAELSAPAGKAAAPDEELAALLKDQSDSLPDGSVAQPWHVAYENGPSRLP
jgi:hypothetical protein